MFPLNFLTRDQEQYLNKLRGKMKFQHKLMQNNYNKQDFLAIKKLLNKRDIVLTQSKKVEEFERKWSKWLGVKFSTFVNSGSSANFISIAILRALNKNKNNN